MPPKILVFFPQNPYPAQTGAHQRCLEMLAGWKEMGYEITLLSFSHSAGFVWNESSIRELRSKLIKDIRIYPSPPLFYNLRKNVRKMLEPFFPIFILVGVSSGPTLHCPPKMRRWFLNTVAEIEPDMILMNYTYWDPLLDHQKYNSIVRIIDSHDLVTLNQQYQRKLAKSIPFFPPRTHKVDERILAEDFGGEFDLQADPREFRIYDQYHYTLVISQEEAELIKRNTQNTKVMFLPMTYEPHKTANLYNGPALFPAGPNLFNVQGYLYFVRKVLPQVRDKIPDFCLQVTGQGSKLVYPEANILLSGFVPDLKKLYEQARFVVSPLLGGTGQQVKVVEAMAHGVPVIILKTRSRDVFPVQHRVNGLIANNAQEFADYVIELWRDRQLCSRLGHAARETIAVEYSRTCLLERLSAIKKNVTV